MEEFRGPGDWQAGFNSLSNGFPCPFLTRGKPGGNETACFRAAPRWLQDDGYKLVVILSGRPSECEPGQGGGGRECAGGLRGFWKRQGDHRGAEPKRGGDNLPGARAVWYHGRGWRE